ncbi:MAG: tetratricopeptide repeat protein [Spirochaetaceae bacterium]|nr:tetratricopeptide repeat protein [Spirochaetaceae bacterium]
MKKLALIAAAMVFFSCKLIPEIEGDYPEPKRPELSGRERDLFNRPGDRNLGADSGDGPQDPAGTEEASVSLPAEEPGSEPGEPELPDPVLELAEADYPEKTPGEELPVRPAAPPVVPPPAVPPPLAPPAPPAAQTAPVEPPRPRRETPPPSVPATVRPSWPAPPPEEQEQPVVSVPDMPFQPLSGESAEAELNYSRTVRVLTGQYLEIPFRGSGWIYLGEFGSRRGVRFDSRRNDDEGMIFVFQAEHEGTYSLRFSRQDFIHDHILNDYVKVIVETSPATTGSAWSNAHVAPDRVYASPRWPPVPEPAGAAPGIAAGTVAATSGLGTSAAPGESSAAGGDGTSVPGGAAGPGIAAREPEGSAGSAAVSGLRAPDALPADPPSPDSLPPEVQSPVAGDWIRRAREEYDGGRIAGALNALDQFMRYYPGGSDEAYWLYGQSLEANNETTRDIRRSLEYYRRLVREYPQSSRYDEARRRIAYLERFYFNIQ